MADDSSPGPVLPIYLNVDQAFELIGDQPALADMLEMLRVSLTRDISQVERLLEENDLFMANRFLHALKGFIPLFCGESLVKEVTDLELLSKTASAAEVSAAYAELKPKLKQLSLEVEQHLG